MFGHRVVNPISFSGFVVTKEHTLIALSSHLTNVLLILISQPHRCGVVCEVEFLVLFHSFLVHEV